MNSREASQKRGSWISVRAQLSKWTTKYIYSMHRYSRRISFRAKAQYASMMITLVADRPPPQETAAIETINQSKYWTKTLSSELRHEKRENFYRSVSLMITDRVFSPQDLGIVCFYSCCWFSVEGMMIVTNILNIKCVLDGQQLL